MAIFSNLNGDQFPKGSNIDSFSGTENVVAATYRKQVEELVFASTGFFIFKFKTSFGFAIVIITSAFYLLGYSCFTEVLD